MIEVQKIQFTISEEEIEEMTEKKISQEDMKKILAYIENDEGIWEAIETAKRDAIASVMRQV